MYKNGMDTMDIFEVTSNFGVFLDLSLAAANLTQTELAKKLGCTQSLISRWCRNKDKPGEEKLKKVCVLLKGDEEKIRDKFYN